MYPRVIYFCNKTICNYAKKMEAKWKHLNPTYEIKIYDDEMCKKFLLLNYGKLYCDVFDYLKDGPIKADFWRICILDLYGGIYSDIDIDPILPLDDWIEKDADFVTCSSYWDEMGFNYNPSFIVSNKNNVILKNCINWYLYKYAKKEKYIYWNYSIMRSLTDNLKIENYTKNDGLYHFKNMKIQIVKECRDDNRYNEHNIYNGKIVFYNRNIEWDYKTHKLKNFI
jgi:mannosyltransferase OCH1-like enzyme